MAISKLILNGVVQMDLTQDTVTAGTLMSPETAHGADGEPITGTATGGGGGSVEEKDVNFIDYDGTVLYSYTAQEAAALEALPANPSHTGLVAQGWNWTLVQIKNQLVAMPNGQIWIGQSYITDDGKTRVYCHFEEGRLSPYLGIGVNGTVEINWGDGSSTDTLTGTNVATIKNVQHFYSSKGDYLITLTVQSGSFRIYGTANATHLIKKSTTPATYVSRVYASSITRIELGANVNLGSNYAFYYCYGLRSITIPSSLTSIGPYSFNICANLSSVTIPNGITSISNTTFSGCYGLKSVSLPGSITSLGNSVFQNCYSLVSVTVPNGVTSIGTNVFQNCYSLRSVALPRGLSSIGSNTFSTCYSLPSFDIPSGVTSIGTSAFGTNCSLASIIIPSGVTTISSNAFYNCYGLGEIHFKPTTPPTVANSSAWTSIPTDCKIYVPAGTLSAYTSATNYPSSSTYTYVEESA